MERKIINKLKEWKIKAHRKPMILQGCRQIGKTYSLLKFAEEEFKNYHYINFEESTKFRKIFEEDLNPVELIKAISLELESSIDLKEDLLIFDEVQECPRAITSLKYFCESMPELALCSAGSLLGVRLNELSFPVGKVDEINMFVMSFEEFLEATGKTLLLETYNEINNLQTIPENVHDKLWELLKVYFIVGGLPEIVQLYIENQEDPYEAYRLVRERQSQLIKNYISDMAKHSGKENSVHLEKLWTNIPLQLSKEHDGSFAKFKFKGVIPEKDRYSRIASTIDWLQAAGLIIRIPILFKAQKPLLAYTKDNTFKLFIFDVGILGALSGLDPKDILSYDYGTYKGYFAENFVAEEFLYSDLDSKKLFAWSENRSEIEFLREIDGELYPIEVKSGKITKAKSLSIFAEKYKVPYKTIFSARNLKIDKKLGLHQYPLYLASKFPLKNL